MQVVVSTNANVWSGGMQSGGQVSAITHVAPLQLREALPLYEMWVFTLSNSRRRMRPIVQQLVDLGEDFRAH